MVEQAVSIRKQAEEAALVGAQSLQMYCTETKKPPMANSGALVKAVKPWEEGKAYKLGDLFSYEGNLGFVKQAHTSQSTWIPFTAGTEALYGARPHANPDGSYPYTYNMAAEVGMAVVDPDDHKTYECIQSIPTMLNKPHEIPAHFKVKK